MANEHLFDSPGASLTPEMVANFEKRTGLKVPQDVRTFLQQVVNGGSRKSPVTFYIRHDDNEIDPYWDIHGVYGIDHPNENFDLNDTVADLGPDIHKYWPVAYDEGGSDYALVLAGPEKGEIHHVPWDQQLDPEVIRTSHVADCLDDFAAKLVGKGVPISEVDTFWEL